MATNIAQNINPLVPLHRESASCVQTPSSTWQTYRAGERFEVLNANRGTIHTLINGLDWVALAASLWVESASNITVFLNDRHWEKRFAGAACGPFGATLVILHAIGTRQGVIEGVTGTVAGATCNTIYSIIVCITLPNIVIDGDLF